MCIGCGRRGALYNTWTSGRRLRSWMFKDVRHVSLPLGGREEEWPAIVCLTARQNHTPQLPVAITVSIEIHGLKFKKCWSVLIKWLNILLFIVNGFCSYCRNSDIVVIMGCRESKNKEPTSGELSQTTTADDQVKALISKVDIQKTVLFSFYKMKVT